MLNIHGTQDNPTENHTYPSNGQFHSQQTEDRQQDTLPPAAQVEHLGSQSILGRGHNERDGWGNGSSLVCSSSLRQNSAEVKSDTIYKCGQPKRMKYDRTRFAPWDSSEGPLPYFVDGVRYKSEAGLFLPLYTFAFRLVNGLIWLYRKYLGRS